MAREVDDDRATPEWRVVHGSPTTAPAHDSGSGALEPQVAPALLLSGRSSVTLDLLRAASDRSPLARRSMGVALHPQPQPQAASAPAPVGRVVASGVASDLAPLGNSTARQEASHTDPDSLGTDSSAVQARDRVRAHAVSVVVDTPTLDACYALDEVDANDTIARVKMLVEQITEGALPAASTTLLFREAETEDDKTLVHYNLQDPPGLLFLAVPASNTAEDEEDVAAVHQPAAAAEQPTMEVAAVPVAQPAAAAQQRVTTTVREASAAETTGEVAEWLRAARANLLGSEVPAARPRVTTVREASPAELKSEVAESLRAAAASQGHWGMRVTVVMPDTHGGQSMVVELSAHDTAHDLRTMVAQLEPPEQYFFKHGDKDNSMSEEKNMGWHRIKDGDRIYIVPGIVDIR